MEYEIRQCENCGDEFDPKSWNQKFCNFLCAESYNDVTKGRIRLLERDGFRCVYCGCSSIGDGVTLHLDHITPVARGGNDVAENLVTACEQCNLEKNKSEVDPSTKERIEKAIARRNEASGINPKQAITLGR